MIMFIFPKQAFSVQGAEKGREQQILEREKKEEDFRHDSVKKKPDLKLTSFRNKTFIFSQFTSCKKSQEKCSDLLFSDFPIVFFLFFTVGTAGNYREGYNLPVPTVFAGKFDKTELHLRCTGFSPKRDVPANMERYSHPCFKLKLLVLLDKRKKPIFNKTERGTLD